MDNFFEKLIQETDNAYFKKVEEMFDKTNAEQYYQFLKEALKESWDKKKVLSLIPDKFINEYPDLYFKLFEKDLQTEIPEKFYIDNPKKVAKIWWNALDKENKFRAANYLRNQIKKLNLDDNFKNILKIYNYINAYFIKTKYNLKVEDIEKFELYKENYYDEIVSKSNSVSEIGEAIANMFANCSFKELYNFIDKIQNVFLKRRLDENGKLIKLQQLKNLIEPIFYTKDVYQAKDIYNKIKKSGFSYNDVLNINEDIKQTCSEDLIYNLTSFDDIPDLIKDNIPICNISEKDFKLLIHNTGWGHHESEEEIIKRLSDPNNWNNREGKPFISTSYISNQMLGHVKSRENTDIIYGFNKSVDSSLIINMGNSDIETMGNDLDNLSYEISVEWFMADDLLENMIHRYNEIAIKRVNDKNGERIQPDYIVAFDTIKETDLQYAKHFNVPIYFIDSIRCMEKTLEKYSEMIKSKELYENSDNILRMCGKITSFGYGLEYNKELQEKYAERDLLREYIINCGHKCDYNTFIKLLEKIEKLSREEKTLKNISKISRENLIQLKEKLLSKSKHQEAIER